MECHKGFERCSNGGRLPSLKLTACPWKWIAWKTTEAYWGPGLFSGANLLLLSGKGKPLVQGHDLKNRKDAQLGIQYLDRMQIPSDLVRHFCIQMGRFVGFTGVIYHIYNYWKIIQWLVSG